MNLKKYVEYLLFLPVIIYYFIPNIILKYISITSLVLFVGICLYQIIKKIIDVKNELKK